MDGITSGVSNLAGNTLSAVGGAIKSTPSTIASGIIGGSTIGSTIGTALTSMTGATGAAASLLTGPLGWLVGAGLGAAAAKGIGQGLKDMGQDIKY